MIGVTVSSAGRLGESPPATTTGPLSGCFPVTRSEVSLLNRQAAEGRQGSSRSHVHVMCLKQMEVGCCQTPLVLLHPRVPGLLLMSQGAHLADFQRFLGDTAQVQNPDGVSVAFAIFAV